MATDDTEITLGTGKLLGLFFLLAMVCGVFFSIGYSLGKSSAREQALAVFDLEPPFTQSSLKARYKVLVKMHHPDAHGGDKAAEEKLKIINQAYTTLKASYFA